MKNEGPKWGPARPSGAGDNYRSRVSKQRSVPWRHQIISLIRGTLIIIQPNKAEHAWFLLRDHGAGCVNAFRTLQAAVDAVYTGLPNEKVT